MRYFARFEVFKENVKPKRKGKAVQTSLESGQDLARSAFKNTIIATVICTSFLGDIMKQMN